MRFCCDDRFFSHARLGIQAAALLPEWEQELLSSPPQGEELQLLPPCANSAEQLAYDCLLMDWLYDPRFRHLALAENGRLLPHMLPDRNGDGAYQSGNPVDPEMCVKLTAYLLQNAVNELRNNNISAFCRRAGVLGHFLQDLLPPSHNLRSIERYQLFPHPEAGHFGGATSGYEIAADLGGKVPVIAGCDIATAAFHLANTALKYAHASRSLIPQLMAAGYAGNRELCREILRTPARQAVELTAQAWHTAFSIAYGKFNASEVDALQAMPLTELYCAYHHPDIYAHCGNDGFCFDGTMQKLRLLTQDGEQDFLNGFGLTGHSGMKFFTGGIFSRLTFTAGLAAHKTSFLPHIDLDFSVETSPKWQENFSLDMEYGGIRQAEHRFHPGTPAETFDLKLNDAGTLIFASRAQAYTNEKGMIAFDIPHIGIVEPVLYM